MSKTKTKSKTVKIKVIEEYPLFFEEIKATHYSKVHDNGANEFPTSFKKASRSLKRAHNKK